jgi:hypothetical protein
MDSESKLQQATLAAELIWYDLSGRSGTGTDQVDEETKAEILEKWRDIIASTTK